MREPSVFAVRVDLALLAREMICLESDRERSDWLLGFQMGSSGVSAMARWSSAKLAGWAFGNRSLDEALAYQAQKRAAGERSAVARRMRTGTAQPSNTVRTPFERTSERTSERSPNEPSNELPNEPRTSYSRGQK